MPSALVWVDMYRFELADLNSSLFEAVLFVSLELELFELHSKVSFIVN